jgi:transcription elongation factor Elf1
MCEMKEESKVVKAHEAISFTCWNCGTEQLAYYTLEPGWYEDRAVNEDKIDCIVCGQENHVIEEL